MGLAVAIVVAVTLATAAVRPAGETQIGAREQLSERGTFRATLMSSEDPIVINRLHSWTLRVTTTDGAPVSDAHIVVHGDMPEHGHGMPTKPVVTRYLGNGSYLVEGMQFQMGGYWVIDFVIAVGGTRDTVHFELQLNG